MTTTTGPWGPLGTVTRADGNATVEFRRSYAQPPAEIWDAVTDFDRLARWFERAEGEATVGGAVRLYMEDDITVELAITDCQPLQGFAAEWHHPGHSLSYISLRLTTTDDGTELHFVHHGFSPGHVDEYGPGWHHYIDGLTAHLNGGAPPKWSEYWPALRASYR